MKKIILPLLAATLLSGCETVHLHTRADRMAMTQDQLMMQEQQRRLAGRIEALEMEIGRIQQDMERLRGHMESRTTALEQKSEADKQEIVARLSAELDRLLRQASPPAPARSSSARASSSGYEHIVRPGETLSTIARAYNVSPKTIIDANNISNPNVLSVGQKLFIPD